MSSNSPRCLFEDDSGNIWIGSKDGGLVKIKPDGSKKIYSTNTGMSNNYVFCVEQLPNGNIIVGTYNGGLNIITKDDEIKCHGNSRRHNRLAPDSQNPRDLLAHDGFVTDPQRTAAHAESSPWA